MDHELHLLTNKPQIYAANVDEDSLIEDNPYVKIVLQVASEHKVEVVKICAKLEQELIDMPESERREYLQLAGAEETGLEQIIRKGYALLGLISFFTMNEEEVRAWTVPQGTTAPKAAGVIHTDFERGFIGADVISYIDLMRVKSLKKARELGLIRLEGKNYSMKDGDVVEFRFNV